MNCAKITSINRVEFHKFTGKCSVFVSLRGMQEGLKHNIEIILNQIPEWWGIDDNGYNIEHKLTKGATIYYDYLCTKTRRLIKPRFEP